MGGGAGGSFSDLAAAYSLTSTIVSGTTAVTTVLDLPIFFVS